jgi:DNA-binding protein YbaB
MKCCETFRNTSGEGAYLVKTDTSVLKPGDQTGLETLVVQALNDANSLLVNNKKKIN